MKLTVYSKPNNELQNIVFDAKTRRSLAAVMLWASGHKGVRTLFHQCMHDRKMAPVEFGIENFPTLFSEFRGGPGEYHVTMPFVVPDAQLCEQIYPTPYTIQVECASFVAHFDVKLELHDTLQDSQYPERGIYSKGRIILYSSSICLKGDSKQYLASLLHTVQVRPTQIKKCLRS